MAHACFYALRCICADWRRTNFVSGGQARIGRPTIPFGSVSIEASPIIRYKDTIKARVSTVYVWEREFMDQMTNLQICPIGTSIANNGAKMVPLCIMSYVKGC